MAAVAPQSDVVKGDPCLMTATLIDGKLSRFCKFHDERTRAQAIEANNKRRDAYWQRWRLLNELAKTAPGYKE
jgi:hypothetical protein